MRDGPILLHPTTEHQRCWRQPDHEQWWDLVPDEDQRVLVAGLGELNGLDRATAAATPDGRLALVYVPSPRTITVNLGELGGWAVRARWFDPRTGSWHDAGVLTRRGYAQFATPWAEDAVLLLEDVAGGEHGGWSTQ